MRVIAALALVLLLSACVPTPPDPTPTPTPVATPVFASEEEALAAAEEAYAAYQAAIDAALASHDASPLSDVVTGKALDAANESVERFQAQDLRQEGLSSTRVIEIAHPGGLLGGDPSEPLQAYGCLDISGVRVLDAGGNEVNPPGRRDLYPMVITISVRSVDGSLQAVVQDVEVWEGSDFCV
ncbi:hypothetical protein PYV02_10780 [Leifsonia sp. H3M29-4]|uniref:hypothetical protein n=1 Tax=Salinibacterium metalliresistens TaxID=3031321 RepID=UPI0023DBE121|nr:hypothetical protein [Salinibacterium metalliresistens]MDF1479566.1 hypothetical protein [Salinibacterium metalliresistens]